MTNRPKPNDSESGEPENGNSRQSSADLAPTALDESSGGTGPSTADWATGQIGQILTQAFSRLFLTTNEESIIDAELAHKALDLDKHELDLLNEEAKRDHQRRMQEIKTVAFLAVVALIVVLVICGLVAWRIPDKLLEVVIPMVTAIGGLLGGYGFGRARR